jgi:hypothetical protein
MLWNKLHLLWFSQLLKKLNLGAFVMNNELRGERLQVMLSPEELSALDDFRFRHRMPTRAAAVRELLKLGLTVDTSDGAAGMKSASFGVFNRGPAGHRGNGDGEAEQQ